MVVEKASSGLAVGLFAYVVGQVNFAVLALFLFMLIDFMTGIAGARATKEKITQEKLTLGVLKKFAIAVLWFVAVIMQLVVHAEGPKIGITIQTPFIALAMTFYLLGGETISIMKNLAEIGITAPKWFTSIVERLKDGGRNED